MKTIFICTLFTLSILTAFSQAKIELQVGGANYLGLTVNSAYDIPLSKTKNNFLSPSFGIGIVEPNWAGDPTSIMHVGLDYFMSKFGVGCELSNFLPSPFGQRNNPTVDIDLIVYPNISYTFSTKIKLYFNVSGGAYFAFNETGNSYMGDTKMQFEGDVIPGFGLTTGYKF